MLNNDILRRIRYAFDFTDSKMMSLFASGGEEATREQISDWLKKEDDPAFKSLHDVKLAVFLNGFINDRRGKKEPPVTNRLFGSATPLATAASTAAFNSAMFVPG